MSLPPTSPSATGTPSGLAVPDRNVLRSELIRARKALDPAEWERHSAAVQRRVLAIPEWRDARTVAMYIAVRNEISTDEIINDARGPKANRCSAPRLPRARAKESWNRPVPGL